MAHDTFPAVTEPRPDTVTTEFERCDELRVPHHSEIETKDYVVEKDGLTYAGTHLLADLWEGRNLDSLEVVERTLAEAATACGATLINVQSHHFNASGGVSAVAMLAESHISVHTWPERGYAAVDIFMCGACDPYRAISALQRGLSPKSIQLSELKRGIFS